MRHWLLASGALLLWSCRDSPGEPARPDAAVAAAARAIEPWTLGVVRAETAIALPPGCEHRAPPLRAVVPRPTRLSADPGTLGFVLVAEGGPGAPLQSKERAHAAGLGTPWRPDGAVLLELGDGSVHATPAPWRDGRPFVGRAGARWLFALPGTPVELVRDATHEVIEGTLVDFRCSGSCALLVDKPPALYTGQAETPLADWLRPRLGPGRPVALVTDRTSHRPFVAAMEHAGAIVLPGGVSLPVTGEILAASGTPDLALVRHATAGSRCGDEPGGLEVLTRSAPPRRLLGAAPAERASIHPLEKGVLVLWIAAARCGASARLLYGAFLRPDGEPVGPVTALAEADDYAAAGDGFSVDLWVTAAGTASWARARCAPP